MILSLPFPPTGNHATKHGRNGAHWTTPEARSYRAHVSAQVQALDAAKGILGSLAVVAEIYPPDRRKRDMDNTWKTLADCLTHAGVWMDDFQINDLRLVRREVRKGGQVVVHIEELEQ